MRGSNPDINVGPTLVRGQGRIQVESRLEMADRGTTWRDSEVKALLDIWGSEVVQQQLKDSYWNNAVVQRIVDSLSEFL